MIAAIGGWLSCNWKILTVLGGLLGAGVTGTVNHVTDAGARFTVLEIQAVRDSAQLAGIQHDVYQIRCMVVLNAQGLNPLDCLKE